MDKNTFIGIILMIVGLLLFFLSPETTIFGGLIIKTKVLGIILLAGGAILSIAAFVG